MCFAVGALSFMHIIALRSDLPALLSYNPSSLAFPSTVSFSRSLAALLAPTRKRMDFVINTATTVTFVLMYLFGLGGYLYAGSETQGNILLNVVDSTGSDDLLFFLGRVGVGMTIVLATPLMLLPCRESLLEVVDEWFHTPDEVAEVHPGAGDGEEPGEGTSLLVRREPIQMDRIFRNPYVHYGTTFAIVVACYIAAVAIEGVATVWSLCGSSMAFLIAFILPTACFLKIEKELPQRQQRNGDLSHLRRFARVLLWAAAVGAVVCTYNTVYRLIRT